MCAELQRCHRRGTLEDTSRARSRGSRGDGILSFGPFTAFLDASVLYPAPLRDLLLELAVSDVYRAKWSNAVHDEWINALLKSRDDLTRERLGRTRDLMNAHVRDAIVNDFDQLIGILELPDPNDRHVLAAAIKGRADVIVTGNLKDFPRSKLAPWGIEAQHPDEFLTPVPPFAAAVSSRCEDGPLTLKESAEDRRRLPRYAACAEPLGYGQRDQEFNQFI